MCIRFKILIKGEKLNDDKILTFIKEFISLSFDSKLIEILIKIKTLCSYKINQSVQL